MTDHSSVTFPGRQRFDSCPAGDVPDATADSPRPSRAVIEFPRVLGPSLPTLLGRLRFRHLALLAALDEHRNLHRAAAAVHLAQPSATKVVHDLEQIFGFSLFDRVPTGMQPTEPGSVVLEFARRALADLKRFAHDLDGRKAGRHGQLIIGSPMGVAPGFVAHAIGELKQRRPLLSVKMLGAPSDEVTKQLINGHIDMAVGYFGRLIGHHAVDYALLGTEALAVVARKHHPLSHELRLSVRDLQRAIWILPPLASSAREAIDESFELAGLNIPANVIESDSVGAILGLLLTSHAVTILPESIIRDHGQSLVRLPVPIGEHQADFGILSRRGEPLSTCAREFTELLRRHACPETGGPARPVIRATNLANRGHSRQI
jgi:DNA-binding transcriptional LysR family regulator